MKQIECSQVAGEIEDEVDAFDEVMMMEHPTRSTLDDIFGKGISNKRLQGNESGTYIIVPSEVVDSMKAHMQKELESQKEALQVELQVDKENLAKEREAQAAISRELHAQIAIVAEMKLQLENEKQKVACDLAVNKKKLLMM